MGKHRKKVKRKRSCSDADKKASGNASVPSFSGATDHDGEELNSVKTPQAASLGSEMLPSQNLRKRQKKRQRKTPKRDTAGKKDEESFPGESDDDKIAAFSNEALERSLVGDQTVFLDHSKRLVYSGLERSTAGSRKTIDIIGRDGTVELNSTQVVDNIKDQFNDKCDREESGSDFPFEIDPDDHCESPLQAYQDILPFLKSMPNQKLSKGLRIYDPYYCDGAVRRNLESLGFPNVYNQNEDCYKVWTDPKRYPSFEVLVTNPPYSGDHMENLMKHITSPAYGNRPWMLLLPQFVHKKDYYLKLTANIQPFYVVPKKRYVYLPPPSFREAKKSDVHKKSSPFVSMWYVWGGTLAQNEHWLKVARTQCHGTCDVARSKSALRDLRRKR